MGSNIRNIIVSIMVAMLFVIVTAIVLGWPQGKAHESPGVTGQSETAGQMQSGHSHDGEVVEIPVDAGVAVPTIEIEVIPDRMAGWNLHIATTDFLWGPEHASGPIHMGEGHAHLYIDGKKIGRIYGPWTHIPADLMGPGEHTVEVELNANNHIPYAFQGQKIADRVTVTVE